MGVAFFLGSVTRSRSSSGLRTTAVLTGDQDCRISGRRGQNGSVPSGI
jgi:hypothetical protein